MTRPLDSPRSRAGLALMLGLAVLARPPAARAEQDPVVERGARYLSNNSGGDVGHAALAAVAMMKAELPASDPGLSRALATVRSQFSGTSYRGTQVSGPDVYTTAVILMALSTADPDGYKGEIESAARYLIGRQNANGSWDYSHRTAGDTSISQYAVLGLWEAEGAGFNVPPTVWDRAASWYLSVQSGEGSWNYHRDENNGAETISMTAAGVGSLLICARQLAPYRAPVQVINPLFTPLTTESERKKYTPEVDSSRVAKGIRSGIAWLSSNFTTANTGVIGHSPYYALYGIERIGALADQATLGRVDWFAEGRRYITSTQAAGGGFNAEYGDVPNTSWAVLFLTKSTAKTLKKIQIRRLGAGTLIGGRGLPRDLSTISVAGGHVVARPMDGAVEGMLAALEDPRVEDVGSALAGLVVRYQSEGPRVLRPFQDRFRKLLTDQDLGIRRVAAWSLARTGDLAMALPLIDALRDADEGVVAEARQGLQLLSRKVDGLGPPPASTPEQKQEAVARWKAWYETVRPSASAQAGELDPSIRPASSSSLATPARRMP